MVDHQGAAPAFFICVVSVLFGGLTGPAAGDIAWEEKQLSIDPAPHEESVRGQFSFTNTGNAPVSIRHIQTTCGCTAAEAGEAGRDGKYAPGGKGEVDVRMSFSRGEGRVRKGIYVTFERDGETFVEQLSVEVNAYAKLEPAMLVWRFDEAEGRAKTARLEVQHSSPINVVEVREGESKGFEVDWRTLKKGWRYEISVKPVDLHEQKTATISLVTDFPSPDNPLVYDLRATVQPKLAPQLETLGLLMGVLSTSEGIMAVAGGVLAVVVGGISIMLVLRTPKKKAHARGDCAE